MINYLAPVVYKQVIGGSRQLSLIRGGATAMTLLACSIVPIWVRIPPRCSPHYAAVDRYSRRPILTIFFAGHASVSL